MNDAFPVAVMNCRSCLTEELTGNIFREASSFPNVCEDISTCAQFHHEDQVSSSFK